MEGDHASVIYGTHFPNRLFVGCLPPKATAEHLGKFFSSFGKVIEAKVVLDDQRRSKRFGFVSFSRSEEAERVLNQGSIYLMGKKINVGPAVKKENTDNSSQVPVRIVAPVEASLKESKTRYTYKFHDNLSPRHSSSSYEFSPIPSPSMSPRRSFSPGRPRSHNSLSPTLPTSRRATLSPINSSLQSVHSPTVFPDTSVLSPSYDNNVTNVDNMIYLHFPQQPNHQYSGPTTMAPQPHMIVPRTRMMGSQPAQQIIFVPAY